MKIRWPVRVALVFAASAACTAVHAAALKGRVVDSAGMPVAGAEIRVFRKARSADGTRFSNEAVRFDGEKALCTDADGRFETPDVFDQDTPARFVALAKGMLAGRGRWITPADTLVVEIPDIVLRTLRTEPGRVVDREGRPVAGATVFNVGDAHQRIETTTDVEGHFQLAGVPDGRAFLFVEKAGFRFTGKLSAATEASAEIELTSADEEVEPLRTLPPPLNDEEREVLARRIIAPYFDLAVRQGNDRDKFWALYASPIFDPIETFDHLGKVAFGDSKEQAGAQEQLIREWIDRQSSPDWDEVESLITSVTDETTVSYGYVYAVRAMPGSEAARRLKWLDESLLHARRIVDPAWRSIQLARVGCELFDLGQTQRAWPLIAEARRLLEKLPQGGIVRHALGAVAQALVRTDLAAALALIDKTPDDVTYADRSADLAVTLADKDPAAAERVWDRAALRNAADRSELVRSRDDVHSALLCRKMVHVDRERAVRIARAVETPPWSLISLGAMADVLADSDPNASRQLLRDVFASDVPPPGRTAEPVDVMRTSAMVVAWLLPVAERVDPALCREYLWRALALRWDRPTVERLDDETELLDVSLAKMLARYDREIARALLEPYAARATEFYAPHGTGPAELLAALATVDPQRAAAILDGFPPPTSPEYRESQNYARAMVARLLAARGKLYWREAGYLYIAGFDLP